MKTGKDDSLVICFMSLFSKLRGATNNDPTKVKEVAAQSPDIKKLCEDLFWGAETIATMERRHSELFAAPVDPKFVKAWRDYEDLYDVPLSDIAFFGLESGFATGETKFQSCWNAADEQAEEQANGIEGALSFASDQISQDSRDFEAEFRSQVEQGISAWKHLKNEVGLDLKSIFRRREVIPFILIPRHVSNRYGQTEALSLFSHLRQAHNAFMFGAPFAAIALMRSILEAALENHYVTFGNDLKSRIDSCQNLPRGVQKDDLHKIRIRANSILHFNDKRISKLKPIEEEKEILVFLKTLRNLIEGAPPQK